MKIAVPTDGNNLDSPASPVFGRCPTYIFIETETMAFEALPNPAMNQPGGAGIQAAQFVVNQGAKAVLTGNLGPNAMEVLQAAGVPGYLIAGGTVRQAVEQFKEGRLRPMPAGNVAAHSGMGPPGRFSASAASRPAPSSTPAHSDAKLAQLREKMAGLRQELVQVMEEIEQLEKEN